jgi:hypothetical protein
MRRSRGKRRERRKRRRQVKVLIGERPCFDTGFHFKIARQISDLTEVSEENEERDQERERKGETFWMTVTGMP